MGMKLAWSHSFWPTQSSTHRTGPAKHLHLSTIFMMIDTVSPPPSVPLPYCPSLSCTLTSYIAMSLTVLQSHCHTVSLHDCHAVPHSNCHAACPTVCNCMSYCQSAHSLTVILSCSLTVHHAVPQSNCHTVLQSNCMSCCPIV